MRTVLADADVDDPTQAGHPSEEVAHGFFEVGRAVGLLVAGYRKPEGGEDQIAALRKVAERAHRELA